MPTLSNVFQRPMAQPIPQPTPAPEKRSGLINIADIPKPLKKFGDISGAFLKAGASGFTETLEAGKELATGFTQGIQGKPYMPPQKTPMQLAQRLLGIATTAAGASGMVSHLAQKQLSNIALENFTHKFPDTSQEVILAVQKGLRLKPTPKVLNEFIQHAGAQISYHSPAAGQAFLKTSFEGAQTIADLQRIAIQGIGARNLSAPVLDDIVTFVGQTAKNMMLK